MNTKDIEHESENEIQAKKRCRQYICSRRNERINVRNLLRTKIYEAICYRLLGKIASVNLQKLRLVSNTYTWSRTLKYWGDSMKVQRLYFPSNSHLFWAWNGAVVIWRTWWRCCCARENFILMLMLRNLATVWLASKS